MYKVDYTEFIRLTGKHGRCFEFAFTANENRNR